MTRDCPGSAENMIHFAASGEKPSQQGSVCDHILHCLAKSPTPLLNIQPSHTTYMYYVGLSTSESYVNGAGHEREVEIREVMLYEEGKDSSRRGLAANREEQSLHQGNHDKALREHRRKSEGFQNQRYQSVVRRRRAVLPSRLKAPSTI